MALVVLLLLLLLEAHLSLHSARGDVITTQPTVLTTVGEDARLTCRLTVRSEDILQVTWQKEKDGSFGQWDDIALYRKFLGIRVQLAFGEDSPFQLWNSSIVFRDVRQEDQSCYKCLFSGHPDGVLTAITCLRVSEPPESTSPSPDSRHDGDMTTVQKTEGPSALNEEPPLTDRNLLLNQRREVCFPCCPEILNEAMMLSTENKPFPARSSGCVDTLVQQRPLAAVMLPAQSPFGGRGSLKKGLKGRLSKAESC